jgi:hypothetical protein
MTSAAEVAFFNLRISVSFCKLAIQNVFICSEVWQLALFILWDKEMTYRRDTVAKYTWYT